MSSVDRRVPDAVRLRRVVTASAIGSIIEWYDFFIFATATALVFGPMFFTPLPPLSATVASLALLAVGFVVRPFASVLWGHIGDRVGRKATLVATLLMMGLATTAVGLLPGYGQIGVWAPLLLVLLRMVQGISVAGEWGGAVLIAVEHAPPGRRGRFGVSAQIGIPAGILLAQGAFVLVNVVLSDEAFREWGWRLPFLASIVLVGVGLFVRLGVGESPVFDRLVAEQARAARPVREVLRRHPRPLLLAAGTFVGNIAIGNVFLVYLLSYGTAVLGVRRELMLLAVVTGAVTFLGSLIWAGPWSDRVGRRRPFLVGSVLLVVWSVPFFLLVDTREPALMLLATGVLGIGLGIGLAPQPAFYAELFAPAHRYSGASIAYAVGAVLGGGFAPVIAAALYERTGTSLAVSGYMVAIGLVSVVASLAVREPGPASGQR